MVHSDRLLGILLRFARTLVRDYKVADVLGDLCTDVADLIGVDGAGVMLEDERGDLRFVAASDGLVEQIEQLQLDTGEGPCIRAYQTGSALHIADLTDTDELPVFAPRAVAVGMRAVFSYAMGVEDVVIGALNLYRGTPGNLDDDARRAAQVLADLATTYIVSADAVERSALLATQLQQALDTRVVIEQAKGALAAGRDESVEDAFEHMRSYARSRHLRVHDVAAAVVDGRLGASDIIA